MKELVFNLGEKPLIIQLEDDLSSRQNSSFKTAIKRAKSEQDLKKVIREWAEREGITLSFK
jgi:hypothetical protein